MVIKMETIVSGQKFILTYGNWSVGLQAHCWPAGCNQGSEKLAQASFWIIRNWQRSNRTSWRFIGPPL